MEVFLLEKMSRKLAILFLSCRCFLRGGKEIALVSNPIPDTKGTEDIDLQYCRFVWETCTHEILCHISVVI